MQEKINFILAPASKPLVIDAFVESMNEEKLTSESKSKLLSSLVTITNKILTTDDF